MSGTCSRSAACRRTYESRRPANSVSPRRTMAGSPSRITRTSCGWPASICDTSRARSGRARSSDISRDTSWPRVRSTSGGADTGVTIMPSMIGRSQSAYRGPYSSMTVPAASTRNRFPPARAMPIGTRSRSSTTIVPGRRRRSVASATHAEANSLERQRSRSSANRPWPVTPSSRAATSPACTRWLPTTWMCCTRSHGRSTAAAAAQRPAPASRPASAATFTTRHSGRPRGCRRLVVSIGLRRKRR